jgi:hypothetical protein
VVDRGDTCHACTARDASMHRPRCARKHTHTHTHTRARTAHFHCMLLRAHMPVLTLPVRCIVQVGPVWVESCDQIIEIYNRMKEDAKGDVKWII